MAMQVVAAACIAGAVGCGPEHEGHGRSVPASAAVPPSAEEPLPSHPDARSLPALDGRRPFALHRRPSGVWEIGIYEIDGANRRVYLRPVDREALGPPRLETSYVVSEMEALLSFAATSAEIDALGLFTAVYTEGGGELLLRTLGEETSRVLGRLGDADELHAEVAPDGVHAAFSGAEPVAGVVGWQGVRQVVGHHPTAAGGEWVVERERRRLRVSVVDGGRLSQSTLVPWGPTRHPCGASQGLFGSAFAARGDHRVAAWWLGRVVGECERREVLHVTWLGPRGRRVRSGRQRLPPDFPFGGLGMVVGDDGSVSLVRRSFVEDESVPIGLFGFDPSGAPMPVRTTRIRASAFEPFPMVRCAESAWLPFLSRSSEEDGSIELWTLAVPSTGPFTSPRRRWRSRGRMRCADDTFVSACIDDEAAIAATCMLEGEEDTYLLFRSWPAE